MIATSYFENELILIGGGHSHLVFLKSLGMRKSAHRYRTTLISKDVFVPYSGMLPGYLMGDYTFDEFHVDLRKICNFAGARLIHAETTGIDPDAQLVFCKDRAPLRYDVLSVNCGSEQNVADIKGATEYGVLIKPISEFLKSWKNTLHEITNYKKSQLVTVVGGGIAGVEIVLGLQKAIILGLERQGKMDIGMKFRLISSEKTLLADTAPKTRQKLTQILKSRQIEILYDKRVCELKPKTLVLEDGSELHSDKSFLVTGAASPGWIRETPLEKDENGFILVNRKLQALGRQNIFACGDIATLQGKPRPKAGVFAIRQGKYLADNLFRVFENRPFTSSFSPQRKFLKIINLADKSGLIDWKNFSLIGHFAWKLKNGIDTEYMDRFKRLPGMDPESKLKATPKSGRIVCGGCACKVGHDPLRKALADIRQMYPDGNKGEEPVSAEDAYAYRGKSTGLSLQSVDLIKLFIEDEFLFGKITAQHCMNDIFSMGGKPLFALCVAGIPHSKGNIVENTLFQLLAGITAELSQFDVGLKGGHTFESEDIALGLNITGHVERESILCKKPVKENRSLVITKPLGTGTLFRANMYNEIKGNWIEEAIASMLFTNQYVPDIFSHYGIKACTDVSGFGLAGHAMEMLEGGDLSLRINLDAVPILEGAKECMEAERLSSMHENNEVFLGNMEISESALANPILPILFDPQTSGPLLMAVENSKAEDLRQNLNEMGYSSSAVIGEFIPTEKQGKKILIC